MALADPPEDWYHIFDEEEGDICSICLSPDLDRNGRNLLTCLGIWDEVPRGVIELGWCACRGKDGLMHYACALKLFTGQCLECLVCGQRCRFSPHLFQVFILQRSDINNLNEAEEEAVEWLLS